MTVSLDFSSAGGIVFSILLGVFFILFLWMVSMEIQRRTFEMRAKKGYAPIPVAVASTAGGSGAVVAAISAAVYAYLAATDPGGRYAINRITPASRGSNRAGGQHSPWAAAGVRQNTEPF